MSNLDDFTATLAALTVSRDSLRIELAKSIEERLASLRIERELRAEIWTLKNYCVPTPGEAKAALYLKALEALLAGLPTACDQCGLPAEWMHDMESEYEANWFMCEKHKAEYAHLVWTKLEPEPALAMARAALAWEPK